MNRKQPAGFVRWMAALTLPSLALQAANPIPLDLPRPDGKPGNATKPVKVYLLAGQSNVNGMGDRSGARPPYPSVFLSADPAIITGSMPIGGSALAVHELFQSSDPQAEKGAVVSLYQGAYNAKADYARLKPVRTATVTLGILTENLPTIEGPYTVVVNAFISVPAAGTCTLHPAFASSTHAVVRLAGKEVYRKEFNVPKLPAVVATVGFGGYRMMDTSAHPPPASKTPLTRRSSVPEESRNRLTAVPASIRPQAGGVATQAA